MIRNLSLFNAIKDKAELLMDFDQNYIHQQKGDLLTPRDFVSGLAVQLLVHSTDAIPVTIDH
jgi:hypothetical protein